MRQSILQFCPRTWRCPLGHHHLQILVLGIASLQGCKKARRGAIAGICRGSSQLWCRCRHMGAAMGELCGDGGNKIFQPLLPVLCWDVVEAGGLTHVIIVPYCWDLSRMRQWYTSCRLRMAYHNRASTLSVFFAHRLNFSDPRRFPPS